ncbi:MAG: hypothetical protein Q9210_000010 [Variospora velana]
MSNPDCLRQVQDLEKQLAQAKQQLNQLQSRSGDRSPDESQPYPPSGLLLSEHERRPRKRQKISAPRDFSAVRSDLCTYGRGIFKPPQSFWQQQVHAAPHALVIKGVEPPDLPPKQVADKLLYHYRISFHAAFPLLDWSSFNKEYETAYRQGSLCEVPQVWSALLFSVFACGTLPQSLQDGQIYADISRKLLDLSADDLTIDHVRTAILTSVFLVESNRKSAGWTWLGIAVRIGQDIGLDVQNAKESFIDQVINRPVWWTVYVCDRLLSLELGRPAMINDDECEISLPSPSDPEGRYDGSEKTCMGPSQSLLVSTVQVIRGISKLLKVLKEPTASPLVVQSFDLLFDECVDLFPTRHQTNAFGSLDPHEISPVIYLQNARLTLHRQNLSIKNAPSARSHAVDKCIEIAKQSTRYLARCMPDLSGEATHARAAHDSWRGPLTSAANAFLCTHIWRCSLFLTFGAEYEDASVCAQASAAIGPARAVNVACGRYLEFFLQRLALKLQDGAGSLDMDEEMLALVSGDLQGNADNSWIWKDMDGGEQADQSRQFSPSNSTPVTAHDDDCYTWSNWDGNLDTLHRLLQSKRQQQYSPQQARGPLRLPSQVQQQSGHLASPVSPGGSETPQSFLLHNHAPAFEQSLIAMKFHATYFLIGAASAWSSPFQHAFQLPQEASEAWTSPLRNLQDSLKSLTADARAVWDEVAQMYPAEMDRISFFSTPKTHTRRPDEYWHHAIKGADVQSVWVENADGKKERDVEGKLEDYNLRTRKVDPSSLGVDPGVKQYSGYLDDEANDKHLFYWFFESRNDPQNDPVVLWINGGPGCSSLTGLFLELGPASIDSDINVVRNPYSWNANASVIFLDQPVNTGFSYSGSSVSNTIAAGKDVYALLTLFFKQFPEYAHQDFHIAGESYAGHYIPVFTSQILAYKKRNINLKSILIGNGLTDALTQYDYYRPMACGKGGWPAVLDESECRSMDNAIPRCKSLIEGCYSSGSVWPCVAASVYCNNAIIGPYQRTGQNPYDIRVKCADGVSLCYKQLNWITKYLNQPHVIEALGAETDGYDSCNFEVNHDFLLSGDWMQPFHRLVPQILKEIPVLVYAGDADFICNHLGNRAWTEALEWHGQSLYNEAPLGDLTLTSDYNEQLVKGTKIGQVKSSGNFTFMRLHAGGHMVPLDQPEASAEFLGRWLSGEWMGK